MTQDELKYLMRYEPETGHFRWNVKPCERINKDAIAGSKHPDRYVIIRFNGMRYGAHRLAFLYMTNFLPIWPVDEVDHKNLIKSDNRWENLRLADRSNNNANKNKQSNNTSGFKGVSWSRGNEKWLAQIEVKGVKPYLGYFDTPEAAYEAYTQAAKKYFADFARPIA